MPSSPLGEPPLSPIRSTPVRPFTPSSPQRSDTVRHRPRPHPMIASTSAPGTSEIVSSPASVSPIPPPSFLHETHQQDQKQQQQQQQTETMSAMAIPKFSPLFTLIDNASTRTTHHPRVHYIFSDDDEPESLRNALSQQPLRPHTRPDPATTATSHDRPVSRGSGIAASSSTQSSATSSSRIPGASTDRAIVVDLCAAPDGSWDVAWAASLAPDWAVVHSRISRVEEAHAAPARPAATTASTSSAATTAAAAAASGTTLSHPAAASSTASVSTALTPTSARHDLAGPSTDNDDDAGTPMLQIEGMENDVALSTHHLPPPSAAAAARSLEGSGLLRSSAGGADGAAPHGGREDPAALVEEFKRRMDLIRKVVAATDERDGHLDKEPVGQEPQMAEEGGRMAGGGGGEEAAVSVAAAAAAAAAASAPAPAPTVDTTATTPLTTEELAPGVPMSVLEHMEGYFQHTG